MCDIQRWNLAFKIGIASKSWPIGTPSSTAKSAPSAPERQNKLGSKKKKKKKPLHLQNWNASVLGYKDNVL